MKNKSLFKRKRIVKNFLAFAIAASGINSTMVRADDVTGGIKGAISGFDSSIKVMLIDKSRGVSREALPGTDGDFRFINLVPGNYDLQILSNGEVIDTRPVTVSLGRTSNVIIGSNSELEELVVIGEKIPAMDIGVAESGLSLSSEEINLLPVARDLTSVTLLAPGVSKGDQDFGDGNYASFAGASIAENVSYINGLNTTNFRNGLGFSKVPFEFYDHIQVKSGGYSAKFGRSTGGVMNATTKSGSNEFNFGGSYYYDNQVDKSPNTVSIQNKNGSWDSGEANIYASGPLIQDRVFFYGLYSNVKENEDEYTMTEGRAYERVTSSDFWGMKLDAYLSDDHRFEVTAFSDQRDRVENLYSYDVEAKSTNGYLGDVVYSRGGLNWITTYTGDFFEDFSLSVSYGENEQSRNDIPGDSSSPVVILDGEEGAVALGDWDLRFIDEGLDTRKMFRVDLSWDLTDHFLEAGLDIETNQLSAKSYYSGHEYWRLYPNLSKSPAQARKLVYENDGSFETDSSAIYIQDTWYMTDNLTAQIGVRGETFINRNVEGTTFIKVDDQWAPRLSLSWDPTGNGNQKLFANAGLYYLPIASNTNVRMAGKELYTQVWYDWDGNCLNDDATPCNLGDPRPDAPFADGTMSDTNSLIDSNIEPMYQSEYILGYEYITESGLQLGVKGTYRNLEKALDDVAIDYAVIDYYNSTGSWDSSKVDGQSVDEVFEGLHQYVLTNPGTNMRVFIPEQMEYINLTAEQLGFPKAERQYGAAELTFKRPFDGKWSIDASYTWAHSWGNNEGYVKSDNEQDDAGITSNFDVVGLSEGSYGNLPNDRRHTIKAFGTYAFDMGLRVGANFIWQTGRPKNCFGVHPFDPVSASYDAESFYCQGRATSRGSEGRTENYWNLDLNAQYPIRLANNHDLILSLDVFNILNNDTVSEVIETGELASGSVDPQYGKPTYYQSPRSIRLGVRYDFGQL
ncbi:TonB-dependent receptor [Microbulbifer epialgicus]|uniref:TonB-dependent receptor domain-containing protein n=1 Tax=Microbulbifer epialgicus TaxID=393907 RepID=A0ABV4P661_9GAMM